MKELFFSDWQKKCLKFLRKNEARFFLDIDHNYFRDCHDPYLFFSLVLFYLDDS
jgi:hypothetical protein